MVYDFDKEEVFFDTILIPDRRYFPVERNVVAILSKMRAFGMNDLMMLAIIATLAAASVALVHLCRRLSEGPS